ncbi:MAG: DUF1554 domain-containing protein [Spirochaetota bacterium]
MPIKRTALLLAGLFILHLAPGCNNYDLLQQLENPGSVKSTCGSDCRIFMTSNTFSGSMGGVYGADNFCRFDPANPAGTGRGNWKAMLASTNPLRRACDSLSCQVGGASENVDWPLRPNTPYRRPDGLPIGTTSANGIFQTSLTNSIGTIGGISVWTGLGLDWQTSTLTCVDWSDGTSGPEGSAGSATGFTSDAISSSTAFCNQGNRLYCVEQ